MGRCHYREQVNAGLVARGFEEVEEVEKDSPTVSKSTMRILMSVAVSKGWTVKGHKVSIHSGKRDSVRCVHQTSM